MHEWDANFWKSIVDNMLTGVYVTDISEKFLYVNEIFSIASGYSKEELLGMSIYDMVHPEDLERAKNAGDRVKQGETLIEDFRYITKDGKVRHVLGLYRPFIYKNKGYAVGNYIDITLQKKLERKLKESEEFYRMLVDRSFAGIYIVQNGKI
ncbi:MAG: PAS domain S-box protein, partial [Archaeoglobaceae archaeon]